MLDETIKQLMGAERPEKDPEQVAAAVKALEESQGFLLFAVNNGGNGLHTTVQVLNEFEMAVMIQSLLEEYPSLKRLISVLGEADIVEALDA